MYKKALLCIFILRNRGIRLKSIRKQGEILLRAKVYGINMQ
jgi:hypothetical protein